MTPTDKITDPKWQDIYDRDNEIRRLRGALADMADRNPFGEPGCGLAAGKPVVDYAAYAIRAEQILKTTAVAAYREIVRLEARHEAIREAAQCPPDADMTQWARTLAGTWIEYNRMAGEL